MAYIRSGKGGIMVQSYEEVRVEKELKGIASELEWNVYVWSVTDGVICVSDEKPMAISETEDPLAMLGAFEKLPQKSILICRDFHMFLNPREPNPVLVRKVKDVLANAQTANRCLIMVGCRISLPLELEKEVSVIEFKLPGRDLLRLTAEGISKAAGLDVPDNGKMEKLIDAASGLTTTEASDAFALSVVECQDLNHDIVAREKAATVKKNGVLEIFETLKTIKDIGGLAILKNWLSKRKLAFTKKAKEYGLPIPKGVLIVGIPGSGKSLTATVTASILEVPLLKLDAGRIFGSMVGESEANMRIAIQTAEAVAPCVLWVDEIEKGFSGSKSSGSTDGGTSARVFGTFLNWMQEKKAPVFVFATANDISQLPPEFLRKGRFDELFFADLPTQEERAEIWAVHLNKRDRKADEFNVEELSSRTDGFTGAEIESCVTEALYSAFYEETALEERHLIEAVRNTVPLSKTMAANIEALRGWAQGRARRASEDTTVKSAMQQGVRKLA
ncbi:MAG TPA: AAA family ATPase [Verrucomicrobiae bacterium]|nr:AAA family ATPase [Verrucomicrobiae bacterium]